MRERERQRQQELERQKELEKERLRVAQEAEKARREQEKKGQREAKTAMTLINKHNTRSDASQNSEIFFMVPSSDTHTSNKLLFVNIPLSCPGSFFLNNMAIWYIFCSLNTSSQGLNTSAYNNLNKSALNTSGTAKLNGTKPTGTAALNRTFEKEGAAANGKADEECQS